MSISTPDRHPKGAPASVGGQFATTWRSENGSSLLEQKLRQGADRREQIQDDYRRALMASADAMGRLQKACMAFMVDEVASQFPAATHMELEWGVDGHRGYTLAGVYNDNGLEEWLPGDPSACDIGDMVLEHANVFSDPEDILVIDDHEAIERDGSEYIRIPLVDAHEPTAAHFERAAACRPGSLGSNPRWQVQQDRMQNIMKEVAPAHYRWDEAAAWYAAGADRGDWANPTLLANYLRQERQDAIDDTARNARMPHMDEDEANRYWTRFEIRAAELATKLDALAAEGL